MSTVQTGSRLGSVSGSVGTFGYAGVMLDSGFSWITHLTLFPEISQEELPCLEKSHKLGVPLFIQASAFQPPVVLRPFPRKQSGEFLGRLRQSVCSDTLHTQPDSHQSQQDPLFRLGRGGDEPTDRAWLPWTPSTDGDASGVPQPSYLHLHRPSSERRPSCLGADGKNPHLLPEEPGQLLTCFRI